MARWMVAGLDVAAGRNRSRARSTATVRTARNRCRSKGRCGRKSQLFRVMDMRGVVVGKAKLGRKRIPNICRVTVKVGKECAIKVGKGSEDWAMEQDDGFGVLVWGMSEVVNVSIGAEAADDGGAG